MKISIWRALTASTLTGLLCACGGGAGNEQTSSTAAPTSPATSPSAGTGSGSMTPGLVSSPTAGSGTPASTSGSTNQPLPTSAAAARFLTQATFGPTDKQIADVAAVGYDKWIDQQMSPAVAPPQSKTLDPMLAAVKACGFNCAQNSVSPVNIIWQQAVQADNQLQLRVAYALSQIFVISLNDRNIIEFQLSSGLFYDTLVNDAFFNFRKLMEDITLQPAMGLYLTYISNAKETATTNPDENYAREFMQLFTIGINELNQDGTENMANGAPMPTYTQADVNGMAKVLTGWGLNGPNQSSNLWCRCRIFDYTLAATTPMQMFEQYHSTSEKEFLGVTIPASAKPDGKGDLKIALDRIFNHPNVGPFIGRQLIQRLVTSNPSPAYVSRVAGAFNNNGAGVRGDMKAVIRAILLDPEARSAQSAATSGFGKLREPVLRLSNWMRSFNVQPASGSSFTIGNTSDPSLALNQTPLTAPSVFNFYSPSYSPQGSVLAEAGLKSPEMQLVSEVSVVGSANYMLSAIQNGLAPYTDPVTRVGSYRLQPDYTAELALANNAAALVDRIDLKLTYGAMPVDVKSAIVREVQSASIPATGAAAIAAAKLNRVKLAVYMTLAIPEYLSQR